MFLFLFFNFSFRQLFIYLLIFVPGKTKYNDCIHNTLLIYIIYAFIRSKNCYYLRLYLLMKLFGVLRITTYHYNLRNLIIYVRIVNRND